jgi:putative FmdB family regulatory protein
MPIFEYICKKCSRKFEAIVFGSKKAQCPGCSSSNLEPQLSVFAVAGKSSSTADAPFPAAAGCGTCGRPDGPGACEFDD